MKNTNNKKKFYTIDQFNTGDWICFTNVDNKKCVGILNELTVINKNSNTVLDQYNAVEIISYIDEDGIPGTIKVSELPIKTLVTGVNMDKLFNNHNPIIKTENIDLKTFVLNIDDLNLN